MKHFSWILTVPLTVVVIVFAVANREFVPLDLWPFEFAVQVPIFALVLCSMFVGFLIGALAMWLSSGKQRRRARAARGRLAKLEREVQVQQGAGATGSAPRTVVPAIGPPPSSTDPGRSGRPAA